MRNKQRPRRHCGCRNVDQGFSRAGVDKLPLGGAAGRDLTRRLADLKVAPFKLRGGVREGIPKIRVSAGLFRNLPGIDQGTDLDLAAQACLGNQEARSRDDHGGRRSRNRGE